MVSHKALEIAVVALAYPQPSMPQNPNPGDSRDAPQLLTHSPCYGPPWALQPPLILRDDHPACLDTYWLSQRTHGTCSDGRAGRCHFGHDWPF